MRENKEKQALSDLMIKPVQRIPRYELLVKVSTGLAGLGGLREERVCSQTPGRKVLLDAYTMVSRAPAVSSVPQGS